jgi:hypothetical protein
MPAKCGLASSEAGLFFISGEYSDMDEADSQNAFYLLRNNDDETIRR